MSKFSNLLSLNKVSYIKKKTGKIKCDKKMLNKKNQNTNQWKSTMAIHTCCFGTLASLLDVFLAPSPLRLFCITTAWCAVLVFNTLSVSLTVSSSLWKVFFFSPIKIILLGVKELTSAFCCCSELVAWAVFWGTKWGRAPGGDLKKAKRQKS